jgi:hypothetical protein
MYGKVIASMSSLLVRQYSTASLASSPHIGIQQNHILIRIFFLHFDIIQRSIPNHFDLHSKNFDYHFGNFEID